MPTHETASLEPKACYLNSQSGKFELEKLSLNFKEPSRGIQLAQKYFPWLPVFVNKTYFRIINPKEGKQTIDSKGRKIAHIYSGSVWFDDQKQ